MASIKIAGKRGGLESIKNENKGYLEYLMGDLGNHQGIEIHADSNGLITGIIGHTPQAETQLKNWREQLKEDKPIMLGTYEYTPSDRTPYASSLASALTEGPQTKQGAVFSILEDMGIYNKEGIARASEVGLANYENLIKTLETGEETDIKLEDGTTTKFSIAGHKLDEEDIFKLKDYLLTEPQVGKQVIFSDWTIKPKKLKKSMEISDVENVEDGLHLLRQQMATGITPEQARAYKESSLFTKVGWGVMAALESTTRGAGAAWGAMPDFVGNIDNEIIGDLFYDGQHSPWGFIPSTKAQNFFDADAGIFKGVRDNLHKKATAYREDWMKKNSGRNFYTDTERNSLNDFLVNTDRFVPGMSKVFDEVEQQYIDADISDGGTGARNKQLEIYILSNVRDQLLDSMETMLEQQLSKTPDVGSETYDIMRAEHPHTKAIQLIDKRLEETTDYITPPNSRELNTYIAAIRVFEDPGLLGSLGKHAIKRLASTKFVKDYLATSGFKDVANREALKKLAIKFPGAKLGREYVTSSKLASKEAKGFFGDISQSIATIKEIGNSAKQWMPKEGLIHGITQKWARASFNKHAERSFPDVGKLDLSESLQGEFHDQLLQMDGIKHLRTLIMKAADKTDGKGARIAKLFVDAARFGKLKLQGKPFVNLTDNQIKQVEDAYKNLVSGHFVDMFLRTKTLTGKDNMYKSLSKWKAGAKSAGARMANSWAQRQQYMTDALTAMKGKIKAKDTLHYADASDYMTMLKDNEYFGMISKSLDSGDDISQTLAIVNQYKQNSGLKIMVEPSGTSTNIRVSLVDGHADFAKLSEELGIGPNEAISFTHIPDDAYGAIKNAFKDAAQSVFKSGDIKSLKTLNIADTKYAISPTGAVFPKSSPDDIVGFVQFREIRNAKGEITKVVDPNSFRKNDLNTLLAKKQELQNLQRVQHLPETSGMTKLMAKAGDLTVEETTKLGHLFEDLLSLQYHDSDKKNKIADMFSSLVGDGRSAAEVTTIVEEMRKAVASGKRANIREAIKTGIMNNTRMVTGRFEEMGLTFDAIGEMTEKEFKTLLKSMDSRADMASLAILRDSYAKGRKGSITESVESYTENISKEEIDSLVEATLVSNIEQMSVSSAWDFLQRIRAMEKRSGIYSNSVNARHMTTYNEKISDIGKQLLNMIEGRMRHPDVVGPKGLLSPEESLEFFTLADKRRKKSELLNTFSDVAGEYGGDIVGSTKFDKMSAKLQTMLEDAADEVAAGTHKQAGSTFNLIREYDDMLREAKVGDSVDYFRKNNEVPFSEQAWHVGQAKRRGFKFGQSSASKIEDINKGLKSGEKLKDEISLYTMTPRVRDIPKGVARTDVDIKSGKVSFAKSGEEAAFRKMVKSEGKLASRQTIKAISRNFWRTVKFQPLSSFVHAFEGYNQNDRKTLADQITKKHEHELLKTLENTNDPSTMERAYIWVNELISGEGDVEIGTPLSVRYETLKRKFGKLTGDQMKGNIEAISPDFIHADIDDIKKLSSQRGVSRVLTNAVRDYSKVKILETTSGNFIVVAKPMARDQNGKLFFTDGALNIRVFRKGQKSKATKAADFLAEKRRKVIRTVKIKRAQARSFTKKPALGSGNQRLLAAKELDYNL